VGKFKMELEEECKEGQCGGIQNKEFRWRESKKRNGCVIRIWGKRKKEGKNE